jgi:hypothetical protein
MSAAAIGSSTNPALLALLSRLSSTNAASSASSAASFSPTTSTGASQGCGASNALSGSGKGSLSDQILSLLMQMQQASGTQGNASTSISAASLTTAISASSTASDPLKQLMSAMDTDGDGTVSEAEMESYIGKLGGTQAQADTLFSALNQGGTGNLTTAQLSNDLQQPGPAGVAAHHHHGHHHHGGADQMDSQLLQAMDTSGDGTTSQANSDFSALDPSSTGGVTSFASAIKAFETASQTATGTSSVLTLLNAIT